MDQMIDLRTVITGVRLTQAERMEAEMRHLAAMNESKLRAARADNARHGLAPTVRIGCSFVPRAVARVFAYVNVGGL